MIVQTSFFQELALPKRSILNDIVVEHGPPQIIGPLLAWLDAKAANLGLTLAFASLAELMSVNRANRQGWFPLTPLFDPEASGLGEVNGFCVVARTEAGKVVATHAARLYDWDNSNFRDEAQSRRLFYADPLRLAPKNEVFEVHGSFGEHIRGRAIYSGAAWVHPDFRKLGITGILPRFTKALMLTRWQPDFIISLMLESNWKRGLATTFNYPHVDWGAHWGSAEAPVSRFAVVSMTAAELLSDLTNAVELRPAKVDGLIEQRRA